MGFNVDVDDFRREFVFRVCDEVYDSWCEWVKEFGLNFDDDDVKCVIEYFECLCCGGDSDASLRIFARFVVRVFIVFVVVCVVYVVYKIVMSFIDFFDVCGVMDWFCRIWLEILVI